MSAVRAEEWHGRAACTTQDLPLFHRSNPDAAKAICLRCPVRAECLHDALTHDAPTGVWGGLTRQERRALPAIPPGRTETIAVLRELLDAADRAEDEADSVNKPEPLAEDEPLEHRSTTPSAPPEDNATTQAAAADPAPREDVAELLRQGVTQREIMDQLHVSSRVVTATRRAYEIPYQQGAGFRYTPEQRAENERRAIELLKAGATYDEVRQQVGISAPTISDIRKKAGIPAPVRCGGQSRTKAEGLAACVEPYGDGHARWTGPTAGRMPQLFAEGTRFNGRHVVFEQHHGRSPVGNVRSNCGEIACMTGAHLTDADLRRAQPEEPVTVQALKNLLDEIDQQGGPEAARNNRLHLPDEGTDEPMNTTVHAAQAANSDQLPVGKLLAWGDAHLDPEIQDQAARARTILGGLRARYAADQELTAITSEAAQLEQRLAELRAREQELAPAKPKKTRKPVSYPAAEVRAWASANNIPCPAVGRVPKAVVDAWHEATSTQDDQR